MAIKSTPVPFLLTVEQSREEYSKNIAYRKLLPMLPKPEKLEKISELIYGVYCRIESWLHVPMADMPKNVRQSAKLYAKLQKKEAWLIRRWEARNTHEARHKLSIELAMREHGVCSIPAVVMHEYLETYHPEQLQ